MDSYGTSYVLFFTDNKIIVASMEKTSWASVLVISGIIVGFVILFVRDLIMFIVGIGVAVGVGALFSPIDSFIRRISVSKLKRLAADEILKASKKNFEVPYSSVVEVNKKRIKTYIGGGHVWYMIRRPPEVRYDDIIEIATTLEMYSFIFSRKELDRCMDLIHRILPDKIHRVLV